MKALLLLLLLSCCSCSYGNELVLHVSFDDGEKKVIVTLLNREKHKILISADLGLNVSNAAGLNELNLIFTDVEGKRYYSKNEIRSSPSGETYLLKPGHFIGRTFSLGSLVPYYRLSPGLYRLKAAYCIYDCSRMVEGVYDGSVTSNEIEVEIPEGFGDQTVMGVRP